LIDARKCAHKSTVTLYRRRNPTRSRIRGLEEANVCVCVLGGGRGGSVCLCACVCVCACVYARACVFVAVGFFPCEVQQDIF
jgi:hypothetical protein